MTESIFAFIIIATISFVIIWAIVSIPVWISAKILTSGRTSFGRAMLVTAIGPIVYALVLFISTNFLSLTIGNRSSLIMSIGLVLAFLAWIYTFKRGFKAGWIRGIGIALLAIVVFVIIGVGVALFIHLFVSTSPSSSSLRNAAILSLSTW
jgi:hypothetical protein